MSDNSARPDDTLSAASRAAPIAREQAHPQRPRRWGFVQTTREGERLLVAETGRPDAAQRSGVWVASHDPVEVRR
jgi:hypothetical protein